jgi:transcriptional regulator with XRE-family HTH domain
MDAKEQAAQRRIIIGRKLRALREQAGMSQQKVADLAGMVQPMINRFETGDRNITVEHAKKLAPIFSINPADLLPADFAQIASQAPRIPHMEPAAAAMPILGGDGTPIDTTPVPPVLATARERYAAYMPDSTMAPRYQAGTLLHVAPHVPQKAGRCVVLTLKDGKRLVREWVSTESTYMQVRRYGAEPELENYPLDGIASAHTIVGTVEA